MTPIIKVENLSKSYIINHEGQERYTALRDVIANKAKQIFSFPRSLSAFHGGGEREAEEFWALKEINFEINQGDRVGIIGRNGAGKSTLLKILSRITEPTSGSINIKGRVASLLEVGTGFHAELTGRENIFLNGAILGMSRTEIRKHFDAIVDFAEVEKFLDTPVKRYSSGMYVRLAFAVAAHLEPEILIVDEVLAVGDAQFQKKCLGKMEDVSKNEGRTVLFVSHNLNSLKALCSSGIFLESGIIKYTGDIMNTVNNYLSADQSKISSNVSGKILFDNMKINEFSLDKFSYNCNDDIVYNLDLNIRNCVVNNLCIIINNNIGERIALIDLRSNEIVGKKIGSNLVVKGKIKNNMFIASQYSVGIYISNNSESKDFYDLLEFEVIDSRIADFIKYPLEVRGVIELNHELISTEQN